MKPTWWLLYAIVLEIFVVVIGFALMALWNRRNRVALELDECRRRSGPVRHGPVVSNARAAETIENGNGSVALPPQEPRAPDLTLNAGGPRALH